MIASDTVPTALLDLAPTRFRLSRDHRFDGSGFEVPLDQFAIADRDLFIRIYRAVEGLSVLWRESRPQPSYGTIEGYIRAASDGRPLPTPSGSGKLPAPAGPTVTRPGGSSTTSAAVV